MKSKIIKFDFFYILSAIIFAAAAANAQSVHLEKKNETIVAASADGSHSVTVVLPRRAIQPAEVAVIVNNQDPQSVNVAAYYQQARNIPAENLIQVSFPSGSASINEQNFNLIKAEKGKVAVYYGVGGRIRAKHRERVGVRIPVGIAYFVEKEPIEIFLELGPVLDLTPATEFRLTGGIGFRYYF